MRTMDMAIQQLLDQRHRHGAEAYKKAINKAGSSSSSADLKRHAPTAAGAAGTAAAHRSARRGIILA